MHRPASLPLVAALASVAALCPPAGVRADEPARAAPILTGSSTGPAAPVRSELVVFKSTIVLNEFVYRGLLHLPPDARATPELAHAVADELATFLRDAGYLLAKVRAQVRGEQIEVQIDEGALDKIIFAGAGAITALRFRAALNLPFDVFNLSLFELQMPKLARQFGLRGYRYELWPVHLIGDDNALLLEGVGELRAMPLLQPARGYELRIFAETDPWSSGFAPEVILNGPIGVGLGGRYRWKNLLQKDDRWQVHFRVGGAFRPILDEGGGSRFVNSNDYLTARWLSKPWGGTSRGLRMTISPRAELWSLQRRDPMLLVEQYRVGTLELATGAGSQLLPEFALYVTLGLQRRWIFDAQPAAGSTLGPDVTRIPRVSNRVTLRLNSQYTSNPGELRQDLRNGLQLELGAWRPLVAGDSGFMRLDVQGRMLFPLGWHELRIGARLTGEIGDLLYVDELPLDDHLRVGFGLEKYTTRITSMSLELRYSLLRDKVKVGLFNDLGVWRHLPRDDAAQTPEMAGSGGGGLFLFLWDEVQVDVFYGVGWTTDGYLRSGLSLAIKEAF